MKETRDLHPIWMEWNVMPEDYKRQQYMKKSIVGKWHYHYENKNGRIGLVKIQASDFGFLTRKSKPKDYPCRYVWEACGVLEFEQFATKKMAEAKIYKTLKEPAKK